MIDHKFEFTIDAGKDTITVSGDISIVNISQFDQFDMDPNRQPGDSDVIMMDMKTAREMHRRLGDILASMPWDDDVPTTANVSE